MNAPHRPADIVIGIAAGLPHDHIVWGDIVKGDALFIQGVEQAGLPNDKGPGPRHLGGNKLGGGQGTGVKMLLVNVQSHPGELGLQLPLGLSAVVG